MDSLHLYTLTGDPMGNNNSALKYQIQQEKFTILAYSTSYSFTRSAGSIYLFTTKKSALSSVADALLHAEINPLTVFPNPAADYLTLQASRATSGPVEVLNSTGQQVLRQPLHRPGQRHYVGSLSPGLYFVSFALGTRRPVCR
jgi:hypothetical protein